MFLNNDLTVENVKKVSGYMKILLTGAKGQLGIDINRLLNNQHDIIAWDVDKLDITNLDAVMDATNLIKPDCIINSAAYTNVDACEENIDLAYRINVMGAKNLAIAAMERGAKLVQISTDFVFDGNGQRPYYEYDQANPLSVYGETKYAAEVAIRDICSKHFILRTAWLYGHYGHNFVKTMLKLAEDRDELTVVDDQIGTPTFTEDLVKAIQIVIDTNAYGIYHASNDGECSWNAFAKKIFSLAGQSITVAPMTTEELNRPAKRPKYSVMKNFMLENHHKVYLRPWEEALEQYMKTR
jgi:dTDP-4-dehydrorhamnose reductase